MSKCFADPLVVDAGPKFMGKLNVPILQFVHQLRRPILRSLPLPAIRPLLMDSFHSLGRQTTTFSSIMSTPGISSSLPGAALEVCCSRNLLGFDMTK